MEDGDNYRKIEGKRVEDDENYDNGEGDNV